MTHVMVPDGVLPWWLSTAGGALAAALVALALVRLRNVAAARMVPLVGVMAALMAVIMSVELVPIGYELHLTVLTGMVIGPWYGVIAALLFNLLRAMIGDGAWTNLGLNTSITWLEIALGAALWAMLRPLARRRAALAAGLSTFAALLLSTAVFVAVIRLSMVHPSQIVETGAYSVEAGGFKEAPLAGGLLTVHAAEARTESDRTVAEVPPDGFGRFAAAVAVLATIGALIESAFTGAIAAFVARVRPELLGLRRLATIDAAPTPLNLER
jgi:ABC-type Co2+ transport system permease subunit